MVFMRLFLLTLFPPFIPIFPRRPTHQGSYRWTAQVQARPVPRPPIASIWYQVPMTTASWIRMPGEPRLGDFDANRRLGFWVQCAEIDFSAALLGGRCPSAHVSHVLGQTLAH